MTVRGIRAGLALLLMFSVVAFAVDKFVVALGEQASMPSNIQSSDRRIAQALNGFDADVSWNILAVSFDMHVNHFS